MPRYERLDDYVCKLHPHAILTHEHCYKCGDAEDVVRRRDLLPPKMNLVTADHFTTHPVAVKPAPKQKNVKHAKAAGVLQG